MKKIKAELLESITLSDSMVSYLLSLRENFTSIVASKEAEIRAIQGEIDRLTRLHDESDVKIDHYRQKSQQLRIKLTRIMSRSSISIDGERTSSAKSQTPLDRAKHLAMKLRELQTILVEVNGLSEDELSILVREVKKS